MWLDLVRGGAKLGERLSCRVEYNALPIAVTYNYVNLTYTVDINTSSM
jgi:hypothetical protein